MRVKIDVILTSIFVATKSILFYVIGLKIMVSSIKVAIGYQILSNY